MTGSQSRVMVYAVVAVVIVILLLASVASSLTVSGDFESLNGEITLAVALLDEYDNPVPVGSGPLAIVYQGQKVSKLYAAVDIEVDTTGVETYDYEVGLMAMSQVKDENGKWATKKGWTLIHSTEGTSDAGLGEPFTAMEYLETLANVLQKLDVPTVVTEPIEARIALYAYVKVEAEPKPGLIVRDNAETNIVVFDLVIEPDYQIQIVKAELKAKLLP